MSDDMITLAKHFYWYGPHQEWLRGRANGKRANLRAADLRCADLRQADLREVFLRGADLRWADLYGADLRGANLREADLRGARLFEANLGEADLRGAKGVCLLTQTDHGYLVYASQGEDGTWFIFAGCQEFTIAEARAHWSSREYHIPASGRRIVACLDWFEAELAADRAETGEPTDD